MKRTAQIKFLRFAYMFGRNVALGQLLEGEQLLGDGNIAQLLTVAEQEGVEITNAQEILNTLVRSGGFGA